METFSRNGLTFDVTDEGPDDGRVVVLLHGFPEDRHSWDGIIPSLTAAGYRVLAPDQRGYSPGARPKGRRAYAVAELEADILALADAAGAERIDVVGHDWGAAVAWGLGARHAGRVRTLTTLSVPHTEAFVRSMLHSSQALHSWYMLFFQLPGVPEAVFSLGGGRAMTVGMERTGLSRAASERYAQRAQQRGAMTGPINWYRAVPFGVRERLPRVSVPTMFVYGEQDRFISARAATDCVEWVSGPYRYEVLPEADHWLPEDFAPQVAPLLLDHLGGF